MMKNLGNRLIRFFRDQKLRRKLMFTNFFLIIFPLLFFTMISNRSVSKTIESQVLFSEEQVFEQTHSFLSYKIKKVISVSDIISVDKNIIAILTKDLADYDTAAQMQDLYDLSTFYLTPHQNKEDVYRIRLYVRDEVIYSKERVNLFSIEEIKSTAWYKMLLSSNSKILWCSPDYFAHEADEDNRVISAARVIKDPNMYDRMLGIYRIDILESHVIEILKKANITKNSLTYLINSEGKVVATSDAYRTSEFVVPYKTISDLAAMERNFTEIRLNNEKYLLGSKSIAGTDWHLVS
jgi:two-component system sensor histidine kinase YesM